MKKTLFVIASAFLFFLLLVPFISYKTLKNGLMTEVFHHLITTRELTNHRIQNFFNERFGDVDVLARNPIIAQSLTQFSTTVNTVGIDGAQYSAIAKLYKPLMEHYCQDYGYANIYFIDKEGTVVFSAEANEFNGKNLLEGEYKDFSIAHTFERSLEGLTFDDLTFHEELNGFTFLFGSPVYDDGDAIIGAIIIEVPFAQLDGMLTHVAGLGRTGEIYLVGDDGYMRSNSRFSEESTVMQREVDTEATRSAFENHIGVKIIEDYREVEVLSAYTPLGLKAVDWVLLAEIDKKEAFAPIRKVEIRLIIVIIIISGIAGAYLYITRSRSDDKSIS